MSMFKRAEERQLLYLEFIIPLNILLRTAGSRPRHAGRSHRLMCYSRNLGAAAFVKTEG